MKLKGRIRHGLADALESWKGDVEQWSKLMMADFGEGTKPLMAMIVDR